MSNLLTVDSLEQYKHITATYAAVAVKFTASWCGPCHAIQPTYNKLAGEHTNVTCLMISIETHPEIADYEGVNELPAFRFYYGGRRQEAYSFTGAGDANIMKLTAYIQAIGK